MSAPAAPTALLERLAALAPRLPGLDPLAAALGLRPFERDLVLLSAAFELDPEAGALIAALAGGGQPAFQPTFQLALALLPDPDWSATRPDAPLRRWRILEPAAGAPLRACPLTLDERVLGFLLGERAPDPRLRLQPRAPLGAPAPAQLAALGPLRSDLALLLSGLEATERQGLLAALGAGAGLDLSVISAEDLPRDPEHLQMWALLWEREARLRPGLLAVELAGADDEAARAGRRLVERLEPPVALSSDAALAPLRRPFRRVELARPPGSLAPSARREACRGRLDDLARRSRRAVGWEALVVPEPTSLLLRQLCAAARQQGQLLDDWGFRAARSRGLGVSALFTGPSGTGKTLAAEVLATALGLDLYQVDLSAVVSKYIGETEKNLRRIFDAAEGGGALLLFDEADALFGRRSEVQDSHDRYANIEVSYLLQRMEAYDGLAVLTTNLRANLDPALLRRLRFVVEFSAPDAALRERIWRGAFPPATPLGALQLERLARLNLTGATIHNIALNAAALAAEAGESVQMRHLRAAANIEFLKLSRPGPEAELRAWA